MAFPAGSSRAVFEMKIGRIELCDALESRAVGDGDPAAAEFDEAAFAQLLQRPVDVDRGQAEAFGEIGLGEIEGIALVVGEADDAEADSKLAKEMRHPRQRGAAAERQHPLAMDGRVEIGREPEQAGEMRMLAGDRL